MTMIAHMNHIETINFKNYPILLLDNDSQRVNYYRGFFQDSFTVKSACTIDDALGFLENNAHCAVVVAHYDRGERGGLEFFEQIKDSYPNISRIIITEDYDSQEEYLSASIENGTIYKIMAKPDNVLMTMELMGAVERYILLHERELLLNERESFEKQTVVGDLSARFAHELRNPLAIISLNTEMSLNRIDPGAEKLEKSLQQILKQCQRSSELIDKVMDFAKEIKGEFHTLDLNSVFDDAIHLSSLCYPETFRDVQIQKNILSDIPTIMGIRTLLIRAFLNAIHYLGSSMKPNEIMYIHGDVTKDEDEIQIKIQDTQRDIVIDEYKMFREVFKHIDEREDMPLYIANMILESHAGYIDMGEKEGEGGIIRIHLPYNRDTTGGR